MFRGKRRSVIKSLKITQLLEGKTEQEDNIESLRSPSFEVEETQEENKIDEKVKERKNQDEEDPQTSQLQKHP